MGRDPREGQGSIAVHPMELPALVKRGLVREQRHPDAPLRIYNYTEQAQYGRQWTPAVRACRGLIVANGEEIVALPFEKFHNLGEPIDTEGTLAEPQDGPYEVTVKYDGSLGISYRLDGKIRWATRGSFTSDQAIAANALWEHAHQHLDDVLTQPPYDGLTLLVEIIHQSSRVVVTYPWSGLVLLGIRNYRTGADWPHSSVKLFASEYGLRCTESLPESIEGILERAKTMDHQQEGFVLRWPDGYRLKVKGSAYVEMHKLVTRFTLPRQIDAWEEDSLREAIVLMPEEFRVQAEATQNWLDDVFRLGLDATFTFYSDAREEIERQGLEGRAAKAFYAKMVLSPSEDMPMSLRAPAFTLYDHGEDAAKKVLRREIARAARDVAVGGETA